MAPAQYGNVAVTSVVALNVEVILVDADSYSSWDKAWTWIPTFPALAAVTDTGYVNAPNEML